MTITLDEFRSRHPTRSATVAGVTWTYRRVGDGPTVLLLHGMAGSADVWFRQIDALATSRTVVAVTYPLVDGLAGLRGGIDGVLAAEGVERYSVVGTSLGGYLAQYLVATEGERVETAVFANTFPPNPVIVAKSRNLATLARALPAPVVRAYLRRNTERVLVPAGDGSALLRRLLLEQYDEPGFKDLFLARYRCVVDPFEPAHPAIPVLVITVDDDPLVPPELGEDLLATYPNAAVHTFRSGGHFPYVNRPDEYTAVLDAFLPPAEG